jgi:NAD(P)-dependent dehydrogenase (short-subunit alcohol dehydrogenase family)
MDGGHARERRGREGGSAMAIELTFPEGVALVAGGTGNVGAGVTRRLAEAGLPVVFTYRGNAARAEALADRLTGEGLKVWARQMDMTEADSIDAAIAFAEAQAGPLRTVACAAGAFVPFDNIADFSIATVEKFFHEDGMANYRLVNRVVPVMRGHGGGSITLCTTIGLSRVIGFDGISPFSKGAVDALIRQIAWEEARHGIRCNAVPISIVIPQDGTADFSGLAQLMQGDQLARAQALIGQIMGWLRLPGPYKPEAAGDLFAFLASDQARFITGQSVAIDGGATL